MEELPDSPKNKRKPSVGESDGAKNKPEDSKQSDIENSTVPVSKTKKTVDSKSSLKSPSVNGSNKTAPVSNKDVELPKDDSASIKPSVSRNASVISDAGKDDWSDHGATEDNDQVSSLPSFQRSPNSVREKEATNQTTHATVDHENFSSKNDSLRFKPNRKSSLSSSPSAGTATSIHLNGSPIDFNEESPKSVKVETSVTTRQAKGSRSNAKENEVKLEIKVENSNQLARSETPVVTSSFKQDLDELSALKALDDVLKSPIANETLTTPINESAKLPVINVQPADSQTLDRKVLLKKQSSGSESPPTPRLSNGYLSLPGAKEKRKDSPRINGNNTLSDNTQVHVFRYFKQFTQCVLIFLADI